MSDTWELQHIRNSGQVVGTELTPLAWHTKMWYEISATVTSLFQWFLNENLH